MTIAINEVAVVGGPLPEGDLCAYSYDPATSCVYLTRLVDEPPASQIMTRSWYNANTPASIVLTTNLYPGIIKIEFTSAVNGTIGSVLLKNDANQTLWTKTLSTKGTFDPTLLARNTVGIKINDFDNYTLTITLNSGISAQLISIEVPTGVASSTVYSGDFLQSPALVVNTNQSITLLDAFEANISNYNPTNTSWGYIRKNGRHLATQILAPFPPPFYDPEWYNTLDYSEDTGNGPTATRLFTTNTNGSANLAQTLIPSDSFFSSDTFLSTPDLSKVVKILDDPYAKPAPSCYTVAMITQESDSRQLLWRCIKESRTSVTYPGPPSVTVPAYVINKWISSEKVYKYKAGGIYFGGKDYSGPLNSVMIDSQDGTNYSEHKILDMNEFPINSNNEVFVHAYVCNYSSSASKVYCVLNKQTGRLAEIDANTRLVKYFTVVVPLDGEICQLYYTNRLMYTVLYPIKDEFGTVVDYSFSLYDANNNGILIPGATFELGSYEPSVIPQFTIIN